MCYQGNVHVKGRSSETENMYSELEASMDTLEDFSPTDTTGIIGIQTIRLKKYGLQKAEEGESLSRAWDIPWIALRGEVTKILAIDLQATTGLRRVLLSR